MLWGGGGGGLFALTEEHAAVEAYAVQTLARKNPRDWFNSGSVLQFRLKLVPFVQMKNVSKLLYFVQIHV